MPKINVEAFFDGCTGAGLFGKLGRPAGDDGRVADNKYTLMLSICATISLLALIGFTILLYTDETTLP